jgi:hypothetical protein
LENWRPRQKTNSQTSKGPILQKASASQRRRKDNERTQTRFRIRTSACPAKRQDFAPEAQTTTKKPSFANDNRDKGCKVRGKRRKVISYWAQRPAVQTSKLCRKTVGRGEEKEMNLTSSKPAHQKKKHNTKKTYKEQKYPAKQNPIFCAKTNFSKNSLQHCQKGWQEIAKKAKTFQRQKANGKL